MLGMKLDLEADARAQTNTELEGTLAQAEASQQRARLTREKLEAELGTGKYAMSAIGVASGVLPGRIDFATGSEPQVHVEDPALRRTHDYASKPLLRGPDMGMLLRLGNQPGKHGIQDVPSWFDEAIASVRESTEGKISCTSIKADFEVMWERVYNRESYCETAAQAIDRHVKEITAKKNRDIANAYGPEMMRTLEVARERYAALAGNSEGDSETRLKAVLMIVSTDLNIEMNAQANAELARRTKKPIPPMHGGQADLAHGFTSKPIALDESLSYQRYKAGKANDSDADWTYAVWRLALESCAYPNISDTITAMELASTEAQKHMLCPPDGTASNNEVRLMQVAYWAAMVSKACDVESREVIENGYALDAYTWLMRIGEVKGPKLIFDAVERMAPYRPEAPNASEPPGAKPPADKPELLKRYYEDRRVEHRGLLRMWSCAWRESGYARVDVSHKLAAALMLTDVGDELELRAPWIAFSVHVPPGITRVSRILVLSEEVRIVPMSVIFEDGSFGEFSENHLTPPELDLLKNFARGVCLAVEQGHAERAGNHGTSGGKHARKRFSGKGPEAGERYQLAAPVKVDLRDVVREHLSGKHRGGAPTVQFIVRGHWREQACGPQRSLRKRIWIHPFWKGDEAARVLLRSHQVEGDKLKEAP